MKKLLKKILAEVLAVSMLTSLACMPAASADDSISGWSAEYLNGCSGSMTLDTETYYSGTASMKIKNNTPSAPNVYMLVNTPVSFQAGRKYKISADVKGEKLSKAQIISRLDWQRFDLYAYGTSYDWTHYEFAYYASKTGENLMAIALDGTGTLWIDNLSMIDTETNEELIKNGTFDGTSSSSQSTEKEPVISGSTDLERLKSAIATGSSFSEADYEKVRGGFKYLPVFKAEGITVDGNGDDWESYPALTLPTTMSQYRTLINDGKAHDVEALCKFAYDDENLYMYIEVTDDVFYYSEGGSDWYWRGDSIQFAVSLLDESYGSEVGLAHNSKTGEGEIYSLGFSSEQEGAMTLKTVQNGEKTYYELSMPWSVKFSEMPELLYFDFLVNDNDGDGRRSCAELVPGICEGKTNKEFPLLELISDKSDFYAWVEGARSPYTETDYTYSYFLVNSGDDEREFAIDDEITGTTETVTVPAHSGIRREFTANFTEHGKKDLTVKATSEDETVSAKLPVTINRKPPTKAYAERYLKKLGSQAAELKALIDKCEAKGISTDYETADYSVLKLFTSYTEEDIKNDMLDQIYYDEESTDEIFNDAKADLEAYLAGTKKSQSVPKYVTSKVRKEGQTAYAMTELDGVIEERPVFLLGWNKIDITPSDILEKYEGFGFNAVGDELGPEHTVVDKRRWNLVTYNGVGATLQGTNEAVKSGNLALKLTCTTGMQANRYAIAMQDYLVTPGKTYEFKAWVKADNVLDAWISPRGHNESTRINLSGTYDWKEFTLEFTIPEGVTRAGVSTVVQNITDALYIDDVSVCEKGSDVNLIKNGGFESMNDFQGYEYNEISSRVENFKKTLDYCEEHNIAFSLMLSPHYMVANAMQEFDMKAETIGFVKYNIDHPVARDVVEVHLRGLLNDLKGYTCIENISISNEPEYHVEDHGEDYIPEWQEYLRDIYSNDITALNNVCKTKFKSFEEIDWTYIKSTTAMKWHHYEFNNKVHSEWHKWMADIVHECMPGISVGTKVQNYVKETGGDRGNITDGTNYGYYYSFLDVADQDSLNYYNDHMRPKTKEMWYDYLTSFKNVPVLNTEDHIIDDNKPKDFTEEHDNFVNMDIYQGSIHGLYHTDIWAWARKPSGWSYGLIHNRPGAFAKVTKTALDMNRLGYEMSALKNQEREIGLYYSDAAALFDGSYHYALSQSYTAAMYNGKRALYVTDTQPYKVHECKMMIVPYAIQASPEFLAELKKYIENGGTVLIMGSESLTLDEFGNPQDEDLVNYIHANSKVIECSVTPDSLISPAPSEYYQIVRDMLKDLGMYNIAVVNAETNEPAVGIEYNVGVYDGDLIINLANFEDDQDVKVLIGNNEVEKMYDLTNCEDVGSVVTSEKYVPTTYRVELNTPFVDTIGHWAEDDIVELYNDGIVKGVSEGTFAPQKNLTRAEFLALLVRASGFDAVTYKNNVYDVFALDWFSGDVAVAVSRGIIEANTDFRPNDAITREEMCDMLVKFRDAKNGTEQAGAGKSFNDVNTSAYAEAIARAAELGLMSGYEDGSFKPANYSTRAEAASVIKRFMK